MVEQPKLRLYNTLTRTKEEFAPLDPKNVRMYVCGPTVYDDAHIGNARPVIVFDVLFRLLRHLYGADHVTYVRNITDVDDKINTRAFERWTKKRPLTEEIRALTDGTMAQFHRDVDGLGALRPTHEPRATDFVASATQPTDMVRIIEKLIARGHAYAAEGHVLFDVPSMPNYGRLSRRSIDDMIAGARVDVAPYKRDPMDFVLWKPSNPETEPGWESPWGYGRPGWHIECSAMSGALLGETFDIHAGGLDLIFPHHENEIAQTCCAFGQENGPVKMASVWMHNGFLQVEGEKMSKSLGNFVTINELLTTDKFGGRSWPGEVLRLAMLKTHYRQPIDWTVRALEENAQIIENWWRALAPFHIATNPQDAPTKVSNEVISALSDDLNFSPALAHLHSLASSARAGSAIAATELASTVDFLGLRRWAWDAHEQAHLFKAATDDAFNLKIEALMDSRAAARAAKNWAESDRIRDELLAMGVVLKDNKDGTTTWEARR
ncbi:cysteine--tRNA ligase [Terrarubrum flagellatum]|uniref:cysteine--tRNA ligase n=1 Tax=Terrirubrum flagellatum TaxID=2895980 RepID=UPI003145543A